MSQPDEPDPGFQPEGLLLKVFSGPHQGAEIALPLEPFTIGSDPSCEVVFHDLLTAARHLRVTPSSQGLLLEPVEGRSYADGKCVPEEGMETPFFTFLTVGGTHFVLGPSHQQWPLLSLADIPELEKTPANDPHDAADSSDSIADQPASEDAKQPNDENGSPSPSPQANETPVQRRRRATVGIAFGLLLFVLWGILWLVWAPPGLEGPPPPAPLDDARSYVESQNYQLSIEENEDGYLVSGYVPTDSDQIAMQNKLRDYLSPVTFRTHSTQRIVETANTLLNLWDTGLVAKPVRDGVIRLSGTPAPNIDLAARRAALLDEIPGLMEVEFNPQPQASSKPSLPPSPHTDAVAMPGAGEESDLEIRVIRIVRRTNGMSFIELEGNHFVFIGGKIKNGRLRSINETEAQIEFDDGTRRSLTAPKVALELN